MNRLLPAAAATACGAGGVAVALRMTDAWAALLAAPLLLSSLLMAVVARQWRPTIDYLLASGAIGLSLVPLGIAPVGTPATVLTWLGALGCGIVAVKGCPQTDRAVSVFLAVMVAFLSLLAVGGLLATLAALPNIVECGLSPEGPPHGDPACWP